MDSIQTNPKRTAAGNHLHSENVNSADDFVVPKVDMEKAARFRPSKLSGRHVAWLVTFVAGMGVSAIAFVPCLPSSRLTTVVHHVWI